ncbi:unnamed protein product [Pedinophyceae sp. YPF-701]|nr:unnamed protein product [Pedinophyceae sp. YPF-701]
MPILSYLRSRIRKKASGKLPAQRDSAEELHEAAQDPTTANEEDVDVHRHCPDQTGACDATDANDSPATCMREPSRLAGTAVYSQAHITSDADKGDAAVRDLHERNSSSRRFQPSVDLQPAPDVPTGKLIRNKAEHSGRRVRSSLISWWLVGKACPVDLVRADWSVHQFTPVKKIGKGSKSRVWHAVEKSLGRTVVLKVYDLRQMHATEVEQLEREAEIHAQLSHPNVLQLWAAFQDQVACYFLLESADQDLYHMYPRISQTDERVMVQNVIFPTVDALAYCHSKGVLHRDIKPENLIFGKDGRIRLADFGFAIDVHERRPVTRLGTLEFMAPEVIACGRRPDGTVAHRDKRTPYGAPADVWSVGVIAYELFARRTPFVRSTKDETSKCVERGEFRMPHWASSQAQDFMRRCLTLDVTQRASMEELSTHPWVAQYVSFDPATHAGRYLGDAHLPDLVESTRLTAANCVAENVMRRAEQSSKSPQARKTLETHSMGGGHGVRRSHDATARATTGVDNRTGSRLRNATSMHGNLLPELDRRGSPSTGPRATAPHAPAQPSLQGTTARPLQLPNSGAPETGRASLDAARRVTLPAQPDSNLQNIPEERTVDNTADAAMQDLDSAAGEDTIWDEGAPTSPSSRGTGRAQLTIPPSPSAGSESVGRTSYNSFMRHRRTSDGRGRYPSVPGVSPGQANRGDSMPTRFRMVSLGATTTASSIGDTASRAGDL